MESDKMTTWLADMGIPRDRALMITDQFKSVCRNTVNSLSLDDLEILASELYTKFNFK